MLFVFVAAAESGYICTIKQIFTIVLRLNFILFSGDIIWEWANGEHRNPHQYTHGHHMKNEIRFFAPKIKRAATEQDAPAKDRATKYSKVNSKIVCNIDAESSNCLHFM